MTRMISGARRAFIVLTTLGLAGTLSAQSLPVGSLQHDGPATPEQISLVLPVTGSLPQSATAAVRYSVSGSSNWRDGHPLLRVRPDFSYDPAVGSVDDVFAWPILDLEPGTAYDVEVTVTSGGASVVKTGTFTTRPLPPPAGNPTRTIEAGAAAADIQAAFDRLEPGDVLQLEEGTYDVNNLAVNRSGTAERPIYIRGASRNGTVLRDTTGVIVAIQNADHVIIENLTLQGAGADGGTSSGHTGVSGGRGYAGTTGNTLRNLRILGVDRGVSFYEAVSGALVYDNTIVGNNVWTQAYLSDNRTWDDDGINLPGTGNAAFNNTISGFGDTFAYAQHAGSDTHTYTHGVHFYRNDVRNSLDDLVEGDHANRNVSFYDNRSHNSANCGSLDPLYGGPYVYARNVCINPARVNVHKWNSQNSGQFLYNNTFIGTVSAVGYDPDVAGWYQPSNGPQRNYGFRNNLLVYRGKGIMLWLESGGHDPIDWTHNSWYPDAGIQWDSNYGSLSQAQRNLAATTPVFSGSHQRMEEDNLTVSNPWTTEVTLGASSLTEVKQTYTPVLADGTSPRSSGAVIPNITDGYAGPAPDRGALITGRGAPQWGDRNLLGARPLPPTDLTAR